EEHQRGGGAVALVATDLLLERLEEEAAVVQAGERIADGQLELLAVVAGVLHGHGHLVHEQPQEAQALLVQRIGGGSHEGDGADRVTARLEAEPRDAAPSTGADLYRVGGRPGRADPRLVVLPAAR